MTSSRLNAKARAYMKSHPGVNYTEALAVVSGKKEPLLGGAMSDMIGRILGSGAPAPDLETAMQNLGFEFPPKSPDAAVPLAAVDARQGDVVKIGERYGLILENSTALLDGKLVDFSEVDAENIEFFRMPVPAEEETRDTPMSKAESAARKVLPLPYEDAEVSWERSADTPLYAVKAGDILLHNETASAYIGKGLVVTDNGETLPVAAVVTGDAHVLSPVFTPAEPDGEEPGGVSLSTVIGDDIESAWKRSESSAHLHVPLGYIPSSNHIFGIDLTEASNGGTGPHGCLQGKTGTGKSTLLHNVILALAATHSSSRLNLMVADFKGRAVPPALNSLPHVVHAADRMDSDEDARKRFFDAINEEMLRREHFLMEHEARDSAEYLRMKRDRPDMPTLPSLLIIVEELVEFLRYTPGAPGAPGARSTSANVLRKGRALGVHLLLSAQTIDGSALGDAMSHMCYGISFAASAANYSRAVLDGSTEAVKLPAGRGDAIVRHSVHGESVLERIRAFPPLSSAATSSMVERIVAANENWSTD